MSAEKITRNSSEQKRERVSEAHELILIAIKRLGEYASSELIQELIKKATKKGISVQKDLQSLQAKGYIQSGGDERRRVYTVTESGNQALKELAQDRKPQGKS